MDTRTGIAKDLQDKCALIVGGGGGLGNATAKALASRGAKVVVADVDIEAARKVASAISADGGESFELYLDLSQLDTFDSKVQDIKSKYGSIDILVNFTGGPPPSQIADVSPEVWREQFESMVLSVMHMADLVLPDMRANGWGRVITSTSSGVIVPIPSLGISNTLRASLVAWSKTVANEVAADGVTVNVVVPGRIATQRVHQLDQARAQREGKAAEEVSRESAANIPMQRYGEPDEYAAAVAFLASPSASYITGTMVRIDGGLIGSL